MRPTPVGAQPQASLHVYDIASAKLRRSDDDFRGKISSIA